MTIQISGITTTVSATYLRGVLASFRRNEILDVKSSSLS